MKTAGEKFPVLIQSFVYPSEICHDMIVSTEPLFYREFDVLLESEGIETKQSTQAARFLHENGELTHFDDPYCGLNELYFLRADWLCEMIARVTDSRSRFRRLKKSSLTSTERELSREGVRVWVL